MILVLLAATVGNMAQDGHAYAGQGAAVEIVSGDRKIKIPTRLDGRYLYLNQVVRLRQIN